MAQPSIDFEEEGLLDGLEGQARAERLDLLRHLQGEGVSLDEMRRLSAAGTLIFGAAGRVLGDPEQLTAEQVAEMTGVDLDLIAAARRAMGLPVPERDERAYTHEDVESARMISVAHEAGLSDEDLLDLLRVLGRGLSSAAETLRALPMKLILRPGMSEQEIAGEYGRAVEQLYPLLDPLLRNVLTLHLRQAAQSEVISEMERIGGGLPGAREVAVCFADLVGFTRIGEEVPAVELGRLAARLETIAGDVAERPVRLVKTIGDAVMLSSSEPGPLIDAALALVAAADAEGEDFPQLRAGAALGQALARAGDWFGRPVNVASRITSIARPGSLLAEGALRASVGESFRWSFAGERRLRGIRDPVALYRVRPLSPAP